MTLLVRDEEDILRANLDFHLARGVDRIVLMDNLSTDATRDIAREYERAGYLHYLFQRHDDYAQSAWVTEMARRACVDFGADWVINADADEFWLPHSGSLKDTLGALPEHVQAVSAPRINFVARTRSNGEPFWRRMNVRRASSLNYFDEPLSPKVAHRARADVVVAQGNHAVDFGGEPIKAEPAAIDILHFPVRSRAQYRNKIVKGGRAYARNTQLDENVGEAWRHLYAVYLEGRFDEECRRELLTDDEIAEGLQSGGLVEDNRLSLVMGAL